MKKLMIAAAAALVVGGVYAGGCGDDDPPTQAPTLNQVYRLTFNGKTTVGVPGKDVVIPVFCGEDDVSDGCVVRVTGTLKIEGWVLLCDIGCNGVKEAFSNPNRAAFWATKPYSADIPDGKVTLDVLNVIGKKGGDAEAYGKFEGTVKYSEGYTWSLADGLLFAGFGKYTYKTQVYNNFKGKFVGSPAASWYIKGKVCEQTHVWDCATMTVECDATPSTVAFGDWTMKYDASASKNADKVTPKTPKGVTIQ